MLPDLFSYGLKMLENNEMMQNMESQIDEDESRYGSDEDENEEQENES